MRLSNGTCRRVTGAPQRPQGIFIPALVMSFKALTWLIPLKPGAIQRRGPDRYID